MSISTHILDTALGRPAAGVAVSLAQLENDDADWTLLRESHTDADGRIQSLLPPGYRAKHELTVFRLRFEIAPYFAAHQQISLYPYVDIIFQVDENAHYHIPLLLTANSYTTYRGS